MNKVYIYDDDFLSLLSLIYFLLKNNIVPDNIKNTNYYPTLIEEVINLKIEEKENIIKYIILNMGNYVFKIMSCIFLSNEENKELILFYFFLNALKYRTKVIYRRDLKCVRKSLEITKYVLHESHKLKGFIRFKELKSKVLYAEISPVNNVLLFLAMHFQKRLKKEYWIIKDVGRKLLVIYDKKTFYIISENDFSFSIEYSDQEEKIESLWKNFYQVIGIKERKNETCRRNFMPKRYWKYIIEVSDEL